MRYLIDSNVIIDYLGSEIQSSQMHNIVNEDLCISVITKIEVLGFVSGKDEFDSKTKAFLDLALLFELTPEVVDQTIHIRKKYKIKIADAIIASTAIVHNFTLLSKNLKDFKKIKGLTAIDPHTF